MDGQITSADDGSNLDEFSVKGPFEFMVANGTTISAALERKTRNGNWVTMPDLESKTTITGATSFYVNTPQGGKFRVAVTTATGTWDYEVNEV